MRKLNGYNIRMIGDLAHASDDYLRRRLGVVGFTIRDFARGADAAPVKPYDPEARDVSRAIKSYSNGLTAPHDIFTARDAKALLYILSESVAQRMRDDHMRAKCIGIGVRYGGNDLTGYSRQRTLDFATATTSGVAQTAWELLADNEPFHAGDLAKPIRALHVRASSLQDNDDSQLKLFPSRDEQIEQLDYAIDDLRRRFGNPVVRRGIEFVDESVRGLDIKDENTVHPVGYFHD